MKRFQGQNWPPCVWPDICTSNPLWRRRAELGWCASNIFAPASAGAPARAARIAALRGVEMVRAVDPSRRQDQ